MSANSRNHDKEMASYMKDHPGRYPDSYVRPWQGNGAGVRALALQMGQVRNESSRWHVAMLGGLLAARLGFGHNGIPAEILNSREAA